ncbi:GNAT family N-acetyltransferase [Stakelama tenebrarum]|uniref:GNAT family N-acetyltransferase n=1 Tax=Stakelama tenebrarum TaxID=2711215 RepID=A0A6G6Y0T0_9SPHN|nr:GNAT family N-acetyltransferase [Sphingosinithalassobacter tenebrarum]QIG78441.1 GNAT family N-acetyltransferase [Sphingosinithalassobacter tenebrarum]
MGDAEIAHAIRLSWDKSESTTRAAAAFAGDVIARDPAYISHGEIQTGLAIDARHWEPDLAARYAADFAELGAERDLLVARDQDGDIRGIAVLAWEETRRRRFAVLEDMAVDPAMRSSGIGARMLEEVENRARARDVDWLFLESGLGNEGAHRFFEREGFETVSKVFVKRL